MRVLGFLAIGGAMALNFEELSYNKLKGAFSKVSLTTRSTRSSVENGPTQIWPNVLGSAKNLYKSKSGYSYHW